MWYNATILIAKGGKAMANKTTSKAVATKASKILSDNRYGKNAKSVPEVLYHRHLQRNQSDKAMS